jgi:hypothetical protein
MPSVPSPGQGYQQRRSTRGPRSEPSTRPHGRVGWERGSRDGGLAIKRALVLVAIGTVVVSGSRPATADPARGPFQVMDPKGTVVRISSEAADAWWSDYHESRCVTCRGPHQAAELLDAVEDGPGGRFHAGPRFLIVVEALQMGWSRAWVFYPSSDETPAYVMHPGGVRSGVAPLRWDAWFRATSRMERIILQAMRGASPPPATGPVEGTGGEGSGPGPWIAAFVLLTALLAGLAIARSRSAASAGDRRRVARQAEPSKDTTSRSADKVPYP